jgi:hypothetical protein
MIQRHRNLLLLFVVFFAGLLGGTALIRVFPSSSEPPPDTSRLKDLLLNTAQRSIAVPPLSDIELDLSIERDKLDKEIERIKSLAAKFGGTAIVGNTNEKRTDILAQIARGRAIEFVEAVKHPEKEPAAGTATVLETSALLVQIRLELQG